MESSQVYEVVVVGAGIIGSATAYYLAKQFGPKVLLVEQYDFLHRRGSSHGESRICRLTYPEDYYTHLMTKAYPAWSEAEGEAGFKVFHQTGGLDFGDKDYPGLLSVISAAKKWNVPHEILSPAQVTSKFPPISLPPHFIGVYSPNSGVLNATKAVSMFQILARQNNCKLMDNTKIVGIQFKKSGNFFQIETLRPDGTPGDAILTKKICVTGGSWTQKILDKIQIQENQEIQNLALKLPLKPIQSTVAYFRVNNSSEFSGWDGKFPVFIAYGQGLYGGPALEYPNQIKIGLHGAHKVIDPDDRDFQPELGRIKDEISDGFLRNFFNGVQFEPVTAETCMLTRTPDFDFILDKVPNVEGLVLGCGFSGHGFKLAPIVGQILAGLVVKGESPFPDVQSHFLLSRFSN